MKLTNILHRLVDIGNAMGAVDSVHMYDTSFLTIEGKTHGGKNFSITIRIKEEEENA